MVTEMLSRWPVLVWASVGAADTDADGVLTDGAIVGLLAAARADYIDRCSLLDAATSIIGDVAVERGTAAVGDRVSVSLSVVEVFPDHVTMSARVRPAEGPGIAATATCRLSPAGGVSDELRDELIALAHAASHFH